MLFPTASVAFFLAVTAAFCKGDTSWQRKLHKQKKASTKSSCPGSKGKGGSKTDVLKRERGLKKSSKSEAPSTSFAPSCSSAPSFSSAPSSVPSSTSSSAPSASNAPSTAPSSAPSTAPSAAPSAAPSPEPRCIDFNCEEGYSLRENPETILGDDQPTCCYRDGDCAGGAPQGSTCSFIGGLSGSLIPNPSFEQFSACPQSLSQLALATSWQQVTGGTTDFWVGGTSCDDSAWRDIGNIVIPQDPPDGDAFVATIKELPEYYEYVAGCLLSPLVAGVDYVLSMQIAAGSASGYYGGDTNGSTDLLCIPNCSFPLSTGFASLSPSFQLLANVKPNGGLEGGADYKTIRFEFTAPAGGCAAVAFGPALDQTVSSGNGGSYVLYDALNLQQGYLGLCDNSGQCVEI